MKNIFALSLFTVLISLVLCACGEDRGSVHTGSAQSATSVGATLEAIGHYGLWLGSIGVAACALTLAASFLTLVQAVINPSLRPYLIDGVILSTALLLISAIFVFLGENTWILVVASATVVALVLIHYRTGIERYLGITPAPAPTAPAAPVSPTVKP